ncbi:MAG: CDC48 family AAA ATPase [Candidatus Lokiarchaeota archaeon]|nr:CDC48 family AAA ATPase [Candidatus Lokiarchaeota archaeon]
MSIEMETKEAKLRIERLDSSRSGRSLCYIDQTVLDNMRLSTGDIVEIIGRKRTAGIVVASPADRGKKVIRIDGIQRKNLGSTIGEFVTIQPTIASPAREIELAPTKAIYDIKKQADIIKGKLIDKPIMTGDIIDVPGAFLKDDETNNPMNGFMRMLGGGGGTRRPTLGPLKLIVLNTKPNNEVVRFTRDTRIKLNKKVALLNVSGEIITYDDVGGLSDEIQRIREVVELPIRHPELFRRLNIEPPKGVLFYGPPGTGKTLIAKAVSQEANANFFIINGPEIMSKFYGDSERNLKGIFDRAERNSPAIIFIDELDSIAPKRSEVTGEVERRVVSQLLTLLDGMKGREGVIVIGATNRIDAIDPALRRPGRFDTEIKFRVPNKKARNEIFKIHTRGMPMEVDVDVDFYSENSHGFVGADIMAFVREAAMDAIRDILPEINIDEPTPIEIIQKLVVKDKNFLKALREIKPSALREYLRVIPEVSWDDIGGLDEIKRELVETVEWPLQHPTLFKKAGIRPVGGILLFGPPGCGKTLLAEAVATETNCNFITVKGPELMSKWVGESEKNMRGIFAKARELSPSIIYFDEIEAITSNRGEWKGSAVYDTVMTQLLTEMDGIESNEGIIVLASTNRPDLVDPALLRPGRIDKILYVVAPDYEGRIKILEVHTKDMPLKEGLSLKNLALMTEGYSGADLENLCREAGLQAIREKLDDFNIVEFKHFEYALSKVGSTLHKETIDKYENLAKQLAQDQKIKENDSNLYK